MKTAVFPCMGLGDGLITSVLSNNLIAAGHQVDTYHPLMPQLQAFFPKVPFSPRPEDLTCLDAYDRVYVLYEKLDYMQKVQSYAPEKTRILNPIATPNRDYPYWEEGQFDGNFPFVDNLFRYCLNRLGFDGATRHNGIEVPAHIERRKYHKRVVLHPTSSRRGKNWSQRQFLQLANRLAQRGYDPVFILTEQEALDWPDVSAPRFKSLEEVAMFVAESGWMIGNDSGIGHLASCLQLPTLTICRSRLAANFWRPGWGEARVIVPPKWIPNLKGMRWRDQHWQKFVPVSHVEREFLEMAELGILCH